MMFLKELFLFFYCESLEVQTQSVGGKKGKGEGDNYDRWKLPCPSS